MAAYQGYRSPEGASSCRTFNVNPEFCTKSSTCESKARVARAHFLFLYQKVLFLGNELFERSFALKRYDLDIALAHPCRGACFY